jgi:hypothetical protein
MQHKWLIRIGQKIYEDMVQLFIRGLNGFCDAQGWFVLPQFRTRYCGHTLSRLAEICHNMTKQSGFPTTRRKELKSWTTLNTIRVVLT